MTPLTQRRLANFRANRRGYWSLWIFGALLLVSLFAELIANDRPLAIHYEGRWYWPVVEAYPETVFGGFLPTEADYRDPEVQELIAEDPGSRVFWPLIPYRYDTVIHGLPGPAPSPPSADNWLGTDDQARDVTARLIYGFRISVLFGLLLTLLSSVIGVTAGALQGYFGGRVDLLFQRFIEIWSGLPTLYLLIILSSFVTPSFSWLLGLMLLFSWMTLVGVVRAEFLRARNFDYVRAARALGLTDLRIIWRHVLPNAMVATLTFLPFITSGAVGTLTSLDFLGFGLPPGSPSLGELLKQGKDNLEAPWLGFAGFAVIGTMLSLLVFIGEAVRDAFDPRKSMGAPAAPPDPHEDTTSERLDAPVDGEALVTIEDLRVDFGGGADPIRAVRGVSLSIGRGETVALVGESGSGKSVTALSVLGLLPYPQARHPSGRIVFEGEDLLKSPRERLERVRGDRIAMIFQEPMTSLNPLHTLERQIGESLELHRGGTEAEVRERVIELLTRVGIDEPERRLRSYPHELSGGQRQRVMIAMALANEPDLLIADEPTTAVDVTIQAQILELLAELQADTGMAVLFITHDLSVVRQIADRICVMQQGRIVEAGSARDVLGAPRHPYTQRLLASEPSGRPEPFDRSQPPLISCHELDVRNPGTPRLLGRATPGHHAVRKAALELRPGETLGLVGESGSGKTSLGLALLRLIASDGALSVAGQPIPAEMSRELRRSIQIVFQDPFASLSPRLSVGQIIAEGLAIHEPGTRSEELDRRIREALTEVDLPVEVRHRFPHEFSGGQRQRIAIARAMILRPSFVVLDEPTSALDVSVQAQIVDLLRGLQQRHQTAYLFISHDLRVVRAMSHRIVVMKSGEIVEAGEVDQVFSNPQREYTRELIAAAMLGGRTPSGTSTEPSPGDDLA